MRRDGAARSRSGRVFSELLLLGLAAAGNLKVQPGACIRPVSMCGNPRYSENFRRLLNRHAAKIAESYKLGFDGIFFLEFLQGLIEGDQFLRRHAGWQVGDLDLNPLKLAAVLDTLLAPGVFHEDALHGFGCRSEEVPPAIPLVELVRIHQTKVRFMDEGGSLESLTW